MRGREREEEKRRRKEGGEEGEGEEIIHVLESSLAPRQCSPIKFQSNNISFEWQKDE